MAAENKVFTEPVRKTNDQLLAEMFRENERLRRQVADAQHERDEYKKRYRAEIEKNDPILTAEDIATSVPAQPFIDQLIARLEKP